MRGIERMLARIALDVGAKLGPAALVDAVKHWNGLVLRGELERLRSQIKIEFMKSRELATLIYRKHRADMDPDVRAIFEEMIEGGSDD